MAHGLSDVANETEIALTNLVALNFDRQRSSAWQDECLRQSYLAAAEMVTYYAEAVGTTRQKVNSLIGTMLRAVHDCAKKHPLSTEPFKYPDDRQDILHRYARTLFKLHKLPLPIFGKIVGLLGPNGIGKSTSLEIIAGRLEPNLGQHEGAVPLFPIVMRHLHFNQSELKEYFKLAYLDNWFFRTVIKPQHFYEIPILLKIYGNNVGQMIRSLAVRDNQNDVIDLLDLSAIYDRDFETLSKGELQRLACGVVCMQNADVYCFDEPSTYLDIKQRLNVAKAIRTLTRPSKYILVADHDVTFLEYLSDFICCFYGTPGAYGMVTIPFNVREGINIFLDGYLARENLRLHENPIVFHHVAELAAEKEQQGAYPGMTKTLGGFKLKVEAGSFTGGEVIVILGENGTGKTTLTALLAGFIQPDEEQVDALNNLKTSYKHQNSVLPTITGTVRDIMSEKIYHACSDPQFVDDYLKPLKIGELIDKELQALSTSEQQRLALVLCLGKPNTDVYLIDEPSAHLDCEQRLAAAKIIKRFITNTKKTAFVVEHDLIMATYLADRVIVFEGKPSREAFATAPQALVPGMNRFLEKLGATFRRDESNYRPYINKELSFEDIEQKRTGKYFFVGD